MNVEVLPHDFCNYNPKNLYKNVQEPRCHTWKLFSADIWKMLEYHFRDDVMLRQSCLQASGASPAQKSRGLRVVYSKNFSRAMLFVSGSLSWLMYIWAIYPRNKFDEKAQCEHVIMHDKLGGTQNIGQGKGRKKSQKERICRHPQLGRKIITLCLKFFWHPIPTAFWRLWSWKNNWQNLVFN